MKTKTKRRIAKLLSFLMMFSLIMGVFQAEVNANGAGTTFTFNITDITGKANLVQYRFEGADTWTSAPASGSGIDINDQSVIYVKVTKADGVNAQVTSESWTDCMGTTGTDGQRFTLAQDTSYVMNINFTENTDGAPQEPAQQVVIKFIGDSTSGTTRYKINEGEWKSIQADEKISGLVDGDRVYVQAVPNSGKKFDEAGTKSIVKGEEGTIDCDALKSDTGWNFTYVDGWNYEVTIQYTNDDTNNPPSTNAISLRLEGSALDQAEVYYSIDNTNWTQITSNTTLADTVERAWVKVMYDNSKVMVQTGTITTNNSLDNDVAYELKEKQEYDIQIDKLKSTVVWAYDDKFGADGKVEHGTVEIISAVKTGETGTWSGIEPAELPGENNNNQNDQGGYVAIIPGSTVTVKIKPDYGYQFLEGSLNGETITAGTEVSTFTFIMPSTNLHLSALFTKTDDVINAESTQVSNGSIANGEKVVDSGNLKLEIKDLTAEQIAAVDTTMKEKAGADEIQLYLDMDLYNFVNKGTAADAWNDKLTDLDGNLTVTLNLSDELKGKDGTFYVIREHDEVDGTKSYTKIAATYDKATGTISFATNKFSTYALVLGKDVNTTNPASNALKANLAEDAKLADKVLTPAEQASGGTVSLTVQDITKTVSTADKTLVEGKLGGAALGMYLDVDLNKVVSGLATPVTETISPVTIRLTLPTSLINTDTTKVRTYQMIRVHDFGAGPVAETLPCRFDAATGTISFDTKYFSTYALVYSDATVPVSPSDSPSEDTTTDAAVKDVVPNTGDTGSTVLWYVVAVISGLSAVYFGTEKKKYTK